MIKIFKSRQGRLLTLPFGLPWSWASWLKMFIKCPLVCTCTYWDFSLCLDGAIVLVMVVGLMVPSNHQIYGWGGFQTPEAPFCRCCGLLPALTRDPLFPTWDRSLKRSTEMNKASPTLSYFWSLTHSTSTLQWQWLFYSRELIGWYLPKNLWDTGVVPVCLEQFTSGPCISLTVPTFHSWTLENKFTLYLNCVDQKSWLERSFWVALRDDILWLNHRTIPPGQIYLRESFLDLIKLTSFPPISVVTHNIY